MKSASTPRLLALALAAGAASLAHAQSAPSVTLYGLLDAYVEYRTHNNADGDSRTALNSGGMNTSRWGMRGSEDLGDGLKAIFQLEGELSLDTGAGGSSLFGRQAWVGLDGGFGRVQFGRSYSTSYDFILPFDPMGYAPVYSWATSAGATGARKDGMVTGVSNHVKYRAKFGGFSFGASYGFGEQAASFSDGHTVNLGASYTAGPLAVVATVEQVNGVSDATTGTRDKTRTAHIGASYAFGDTVKLFGVLRDYSKEFGAGGADNDSRTWWIGANWLPMPALTLTAAYYAQDIRSSNAAATVDDPSLIVLRARYALSKRTDVYATLGYADGKDGVVGLSRDDVTFGSDQTGVAVGIQHRF